MENAVSATTQEANTGISLWDPAHPGLHREFQDSCGYKDTLYQKTKREEDAEETRDSSVS